VERQTGGPFLQPDAVAGLPKPVSFETALTDSAPSCLSCAQSRRTEARDERKILHSTCGPNHMTAAYSKNISIVIIAKCERANFMKSFVSLPGEFSFEWYAMIGRTAFSP